MALREFIAAHAFRIIISLNLGQVAISHGCKLQQQKLRIDLTRGITISARHRVQKKKRGSSGTRRVTYERGCC